MRILELFPQKTLDYRFELSIGNFVLLYNLYLYHLLSLIVVPLSLVNVLPEALVFGPFLLRTGFRTEF